MQPSPKIASPADVQEIADTIRSFVIRNFPEAHLALLFGSRVYGEKRGDIDFKIFVDNPTLSDRELAVEFAQNLHQKYAPNCSIAPDMDVPYAIKTILPYSLIEQALELTPFITQEGKLKVDPISFSQGFLSSQECQMRVILSSFTTPNICLYGFSEIFYSLCNKAFKTVLNLICSVWRLSPQTDFEKILPFFLRHPDGYEYKSYLGYRNSPYVIDYLRNRFQEINCLENL